MAEKTVISGWGRTAPTAALVHDCSIESLPNVLAQVGRRGVIARGMGRAYCDAAQNAGGDVVRLLSTGRVKLDPTDGVVEVDAGVPLGRLLEMVVPAGFFLPVLPGTAFVTVGGAIAADVHGKNHHVHGSFGMHVLSLDLMDGAGSVRRITPLSHPTLFWATVGGLGLTGIIVAARIQLRRVTSPHVRVDTDRLEDIGSLMDTMSREDAAYTYSVAWVDLLTTGRRLGRSVLTRAQHDASGTSNEAPRVRTYRESRLRVPRWVPPRLMNTASVRAFNEAWFRKSPLRRRGELQSVSSFFYPLDAVTDWNRLYGSAGLVQYQAVVPFGHEGLLTRLVETLARSRAASFLAVLKRFGEASPGLMSFPSPGWTLAVDLPARSEIRAVLRECDDIVLAGGGRLYLVKDGRVPREAIPRMYPRVEEFREICREVDPAGVFVSDLARRVGLDR